MFKIFFCQTFPNRFRISALLKFKTRSKMKAVKDFIYGIEVAQKFMVLTVVPPLLVHTVAPQILGIYRLLSRIPIMSKVFHPAPIPAGKD